MTELGDRATRKSRRHWDKHAARYDRDMGFWEGKLFRGDRAWACGQAQGDVLEVAVGTGRNFAYYPDGVRLTGFDLSPEMVRRARETAAGTGIEATIDEADATRLPYPDAAFDMVVCTFSLCAIPDPAAAAREMHRVLKPGGTVVLVEHVRSPNPAVLALQVVINAVTAPLMNEHFLRTPSRHLQRAGFELARTERHSAGFVHRFTMHKPA